MVKASGFSFKLYTYVIVEISNVIKVSALFRCFIAKLKLSTRWISDFYNASVATVYGLLQ